MLVGDVGVMSDVLVGDVGVMSDVLGVMWE